MLNIIKLQLGKKEVYIYFNGIIDLTMRLMVCSGGAEPDTGWRVNRDRQNLSYPSHTGTDGPWFLSRPIRC